MEKPTQAIVDGMFFCLAGHAGEFTDKETIELIQAALKEIDISISMTEAHTFWCWRSEQYDATFLSPDIPKNIRNWFIKYVEAWLNNNGDDDNEPYDPYS
jgi:hypothetical protein